MRSRKRCSYCNTRKCSSRGFKGRRRFREPMPPLKIQLGRAVKNLIAQLFYSAHISGSLFFKLLYTVLSVKRNNPYRSTPHKNGHIIHLLHRYRNLFPFHFKLFGHVYRPPLLAVVIYDTPKSSSELKVGYFSSYFFHIQKMKVSKC